MLDLNNLKEQLQSIFEAANTTTATTYLSSGLETKVQRLLKVNPNRIPVQADWYPFVTVFIDSKDIELKDFAVNQVTAKREGDVSVKVVGAVWNSTIDDAEVDPADEDCEALMESVEQVLRQNPTIAGVATWSYPTKVTYHNMSLDEGVHVRFGILNLQATILY
jgi:hypothetical protein